MKRNGVTYYYITNLQGDVMKLVDADGNVVASYEYDPYGKVISATGTMASANPLRYRGYYYDSELGMYYLQSRYYDPNTGRFVNADDISMLGEGEGVLSYNLFSYCANNPVNHIDPWGYLFLPAANDLLRQWIDGDGSAQIYGSKSKIVKSLKNSKKVQGYINNAINNFKKTGIAYTNLKYGEFTVKEDGWDLYLSTQHFSYQIHVCCETRLRGVFWRYRQYRYVATLMIYDEYDFDLKDWNGLGNVLNNMAYILHVGGSVGNDYKWTAIYVYKTKWSKIK